MATPVPRARHAGPGPGRRSSATCCCRHRPTRCGRDPAWWFHPLGIEAKRARALTEVARHHDKFWTWAGGRPGDRRIEAAPDPRRRSVDRRLGARTGARRSRRGAGRRLPLSAHRRLEPGRRGARHRRPDARTARALPRPTRPGAAGAREHRAKVHRRSGRAGGRSRSSTCSPSWPRVTRYDLAFVSRQLTSDGALGLFADRLLTIELPDLPDAARADTVTFVCRRANQMPSPLRIGLVLICTGVALAQRVAGIDRTDALLAGLPPAAARRAATHGALAGLRVHLGDVAGHLTVGRDDATERGSAA